MAEKSYRSGLTEKAWILATLPAFLGGYLLWMGFSDLPRFSDHDPMRFPLVYGPITFGFAILIATIWTGLNNMGREVVVSGGGVRYTEKGHEVLRAGWGTFSHVAQGGGLLRILVLSDGRRFVRLFDIFLPRFDELARELDRHEKRAEGAAGRHRLG